MFQKPFTTFVQLLLEGKFKQNSHVIPYVTCATSDTTSSVKWSRFLKIPNTLSKKQMLQRSCHCLKSATMWAKVEPASRLFSKLHRDDIALKACMTIIQVSLILKCLAMIIGIYTAWTIQIKILLKSWPIGVPDELYFFLPFSF